MFGSLLCTATFLCVQILSSSTSSDISVVGACILVSASVAGGNSDVLVV